jgi:hypothetical protein
MSGGEGNTRLRQAQHIDPDVRKRGPDGVHIVRVFERGEILAAFSTLALVYLSAEHSQSDNESGTLQL